MNPCKPNEVQEIFDYIEKDYGKCLYIYIDLYMYGLSNENFKVWTQRDLDGKIKCVITQYYSGVQVYSKDLNYDPKDVADKMIREDIKLVFGVKEAMDMLSPYLEGFDQELGTVGQLKNFADISTPDAYSASEDEMSEIAAVVADDEGIGKPYGYESLYKQFLERKQEGFGRNYILRDKETGKIICHAGTYAEIPPLAVIGGVITAPDYRGKGFSKPTLASICKELLAEGKDVFSFYYIPPAKRMHEAVGFEKIATWAKLYK